MLCNFSSAICFYALCWTILLWLQLFVYCLFHEKLFSAYIDSIGWSNCVKSKVFLSIGHCSVNSNLGVMIQWIRIYKSLTIVDSNLLELSLLISVVFIVKMSYCLTCLKESPGNVMDTTWQYILIFAHFWLTYFFNI